MPVPLVLILSLFIVSTARAQDRDALAAIQSDWHLANIAEAHKNWSLAIGAYRSAIEDSRTLPLHIREWYRGTAGYGIARCSARLGLRDSVDNALAYAGEHHFWNFSLVRLDSLVIATAGDHTVDSLQAVWERVADDERASWLPQIPIVLTPQGYDHTPRWPLIIAMHGGNGNYESFASRWRGIADSVGAMIVVPAGVLRESQITNSWGDSTEQIAHVIIPVVQDLINRKLVDSSQIYLTGFSQGAQATINLVLRYPHLFRGGIAMCGFTIDAITDSMLHAAAAAHVRLYALSGDYEDSSFHAQILTIQHRCLSAGIPFVTRVEANMVHEVPLDLPRQFTAAWRWLHEPLHE